MQRFSGFRQNGYRFEVVVPTTIFDQKVAIINVYNNNDRSITKEILPLRNMPYWDTPAQTIMLRKSDMNRLEKKTKALVKGLPSLIK